MVSSEVKMDIKNIVKNIQREPKIFKNKAKLDHYLIPSDIIGRQNKAKELLRFLLGYKKGYGPNVVSVYGRSGSGKSSLVRKICEEMTRMESDFEYVYVNLRECQTIFGAANLVLQELGEEKISSAVGLNKCFERIGISIEKRVERVRCFVIVLDEFDSILSDKRNSASNFIYRFLAMQEKFRNKKGTILTIITISNNMLSNYDLDDRVKSRMGNAEVYFDAYGIDEICRIVKDRASRAFVKGAVDNEVLNECAKQSAMEHGDARRAIDLLRFAAELAVSERRRSVTVDDVSKAGEMIQEDTIKRATENMPAHSRTVLIVLCEMAVIDEESWLSTSNVYEQYKRHLNNIMKPLSYRRFSDILVEFEGSGLCVSRALSKGRYGYGKQYKLTMPPRIVLQIMAPEYLENAEDQVHIKNVLERYKKSLPRDFRSTYAQYLKLKRNIQAGS